MKPHLPRFFLRRRLIALSLLGVTVFAGFTHDLSAAVTAKEKTKPKPSATKPAPAPATPPEPAAKSVEEIARIARESVVVVTCLGRDGDVEGVGTGFVIDPDGLIATSLHVIGEARPVFVEFANGKKFEVTEIHAWDRKTDLAVLRIDAQKLPALAIGNSDEIQQGASIVTMGNPHGLDHSVVQGVVSALRDSQTGQLIQLAIPLEPGNSGGPMLDLQARVYGIMSMKSAVTPNLGFATPINGLRPLLADPNPVPMKRWLTIGALDPLAWEPIMGAHWSQKAGRIMVDGAGQGFGGRSLLVSKQEPPNPPYEVAVTVKLDDEAGAAGLIFSADGKNRHYGFYPSAGQLRLTRFEGPSVFTWTVLKQLTNPAYQPGEWNTLKVRVETNKICCYVNDQLVAESDDDGFRDGSVGLAKFRETKATFRNFQVGTNLPPVNPPADVVALITQQVSMLPASGRPDARVVEALKPNAQFSQSVLTEQARKLERQAAQLRQLAKAVHVRAVQTSLSKVFAGPDDQADLFEAALLIAKLDNEELELEGYRRTLDQMARELKAKLPADANDEAKVHQLTEFLFKDNGFHGSRTDYYNRANSYINEVIDDREGLPITLSVLFMELADRIGINKVRGIPLPGHFIVQYLPKDKTGTPLFIDVFENGEILSLAELDRIVRSSGEDSLHDEHLLPATKRDITVRMLRNLYGVAMREGLQDEPLRYLEVILSLAPDSAMDHWMRGMLRLRSGDTPGAKQDFEWLIEKDPAGIDMERVKELYRSL